jgi:hypothetical protein
MQSARDASFMPFYPVLSCKSCSHSIWLPFPSPDETPQRQIPWPLDGLSRNFGCTPCSRVYEYSAEDVQWRHVGSPDQVLPSKPLAIYRISVPCGQRQCAGLIHIQVVAIEGLPAPAVVAALNRPYAVTISCERGHASNGYSLEYGSFRAEKDPDWDV